MSRYEAHSRCPHGIHWHLPCRSCRIADMAAARKEEKKNQARDLLDRCRAGQPVTIAQINAALEMTGDLDHVPFSVEVEA